MSYSTYMVKRELPAPDKAVGRVGRKRARKARPFIVEGAAKRPDSQWGAFGRYTTRWSAEQAMRSFERSYGSCRDFRIREAE